MGRDRERNQVEHEARHAADHPGDVDAAKRRDQRPSVEGLIDERDLSGDRENVREAGLDEVARDLEGVLEEIRVFSQGLHPALLSRSGLGPSLRALARRSPIPVSIDVARVAVADDGVGGAALSRGSGLIGLVDRVEALGGRFALESPAGRGTTITIELPPGSQPLDERLAL